MCKAAEYDTTDSASADAGPGKQQQQQESVAFRLHMVFMQAFHPICQLYHMGIYDNKMSVLQPIVTNYSFNFFSTNSLILGNYFRII